MRQSVVRVGINNFLNIIKFNEEYYSIYNNIFNETEQISEYRFLFFILQISSQTKFNGYFDELYIDVIKRRSNYIKELVKNFKTAFMGKPTIYNKFIKIFCFGRPSEREIYFHRKISLIDFDKLFNKYFELNNGNKKEKFIDICEAIYNQHLSKELNQNIDIKMKKKVSFKSG